MIAEFDAFQHTPQTEAVQPVLEFDGFNMLDQVDIKQRDRVVVIETKREGIVKAILPIEGVMKARVRLDGESVRHYEKYELRKV